jgi:hypothetical protein
VSAGGPTVVLVHSPLVGASAWEAFAEVLRARGRTAVVPALAEAFDGAAPYRPRLAATVARQVEELAPEPPPLVASRSAYMRLREAYETRPKPSKPARGLARRSSLRAPSGPAHRAARDQRHARGTDRRLPRKRRRRADRALVDAAERRRPAEELDRLPQIRERFGEGAHRAHGCDDQQQRTA